MIASIGIVALNEEACLPQLLENILAQTYPHKEIELLLVDSGSVDSTRKIMEDFAQKHRESFWGIQVLDNPKRIQAAGWNQVISHAKGDVVFRIDAHARIPEQFVEKNMALQDQGHFVTGGIRPCLIENPTPWKKLLLAVENSLFGSSFGRNKSGYVKTMFHAAYRREVLEKVGLFNENLLRTEDNEIHYRIRQAGYRLYSDENIVSWQFARSNLKKMVRQKYANGYWIGLTLGVCPGCISPYHLVPFVFLLGILGTRLLAVFSLWQLAALMWGAYFLFALAGMAGALLTKSTGILVIFMPPLFLLLHVSYGIGTLVGLLKMPAWRKKLSKK